MIWWALAGGILYRWRGHASDYKKYFPRPWNQIAFALPYAWFAYQQVGYWAILVLIFTTLGTITGHGRGFNNDTLQGDPETLEWPISWMQLYVPLQFYKFMIMVMTGLAISLPAGLATLNPVLALSGALKGVAYYITRDTRVSEFLTGLFLWGVLGFYIA